MVTSTKLLIGPAAEIQISAFLLSLTFKGFHGTGFAQPNIKGLFIKIKSKGKIIVPILSTCLNGFKGLPLFSRWDLQGELKAYNLF